MDSITSFEFYSGADCVTQEVRTALFAKFARQLAADYPCVLTDANNGSATVPPATLLEADREYWEEAVGACAAAAWLRSPAGRSYHATQLKEIQLEEGGVKRIMGALGGGKPNDVEQLALAAERAASQSMNLITCVATTLIGVGLPTLVARSGKDRAGKCGCIVTQTQNSLTKKQRNRLF